ncbi:hypothetical protein GCM10011609_36060 [Lentzea pudingi]|uniref:Uncharacterized protein n=1 Tax=Lentzea pudingi TaxID=1789439 RepID=A0ABQ2HZG6_9PSEU|nr:hypothetical protein GCM10011609_36060 [Lentzea pudingi]
MGVDHRPAVVLVVPPLAAVAEHELQELAFGADWEAAGQFGQELRFPDATCPRRRPRASLDALAKISAAVNGG